VTDETPAGPDQPYIDCPDCVHDVSDHHPTYSDAGCTVAGCICTTTQNDLRLENQ
jgi:hypothetical protein